MSYILDALRKADAERERGRVPDLGTLPPSTPPRVGPGAQVRVAAGRSWRGLVLAALVVGWIGGAVAWWAMRGGAGVDVLQDVATIAPRNEVKAEDARLPRREVPRNDRADAAPRRDVSDPAPRPDEVPSLRGPQGPKQYSATATATSTTTATATDPDARSPQGPKPSPASAPTPRLGASWSAPPADVQRTLSSLPVSGSMHSPQRSARMLIVQGQVLREGDSLGPGIKILEIRPRSVVLGVQDQIYEWLLPTP